MTGVDQYVEAFARIEPAQASPRWLRDLRARGLESFKQQGFPGLRDEAWRFTRVKPIADTAFKTVDEYRPNGLDAAALVRATFDDSGCHRVAIVDGHYAAALGNARELPSGVILTGLAEAIRTMPDRVEAHLGRVVHTDAPFAALNTAFIRDGVFLYIPDGVAVEAPVHIVYVSTGSGTVTHPRALIVAGARASATVIESFAGTGSAYFTNSVTEIVCGENADVTHCKLQREAHSAFHIATQEAVLASNSRFSTENVSMGGALVRSDINSLLDGEGIDCRIDGLYLAGDRQHVDNHTLIRHAKPHCHSFELYKGILNGRARGVFNGMIYVDPDAQKTDAKQSNNCMLLSDGARINTQPQLEIYADDVKCTHGATVGQLDEDAVFYMQTRGIAAAEARHLLVYAFAAEVVERIRVEAIRDRLAKDLFDWLEDYYSH
jgi:Fe-S cluster assembly protein SufD